MIMSQVITIANQKGGVAKTTTCVALAAGLKNKGKHVLAVDIDQQANLTDTFNVDLSESEPTIYEVLKREANINDVIKSTVICDIVPANILLAGAELELNATGKEYRLKEALAKLNKTYDYIIIDTPPSLGVLTVNAFTACDRILIPTTAGAYAVKGIVQLKETIEVTRLYTNPTIGIDGILLTRYNPRTVISQDIKELTNQIAGELHAKMYKTHIRNAIAIEESQAFHRDIFTHAKTSAVADDYAKFVEEFLERD